MSNEKLFTDESLIEAVENHKVIYAKGNISYRNRVLRERAWEDIAKNLKANKEYCQTLWRSIRDRYVREKHKRRRMELSGSEAEQSTEWELVPMLDFLSDHVTPRKTSGSVVPLVVNKEASNGLETPLPSPVSPESHMVFDPSAPRSPTPLSSTPSPSNQGRQRGTPGLHEFKGFIHTMSGLAKSRLCPQNNHEPFIKMVQSLLEKIPEENQDSVKLTVLTYLTEETKK